MAQTWLSIRVDLIEGHGEEYWPRPGRIFAAARSHTFKEFADAIDPGAPVHRRPAADQPGRGRGDPAGHSSAVLGLG